MNSISLTSPPSYTYMDPRNLFTSGRAMGETAITVTSATSKTASAFPDTKQYVNKKNWSKNEKVLKLDHMQKVKWF
jgi:hypothetical protein